MKPTKYELFERDGAIVLRGYAPEAQNGWFNVEVVNQLSWRTIPNLRKQAAHLAARWGVPFEDKLGASLGERVAAQGGIAAVPLTLRPPKGRGGVRLARRKGAPADPPQTRARNNGSVRMRHLRAS